MKTRTKTHSTSGGERKYRIKKDSLSTLENSYTDLSTGKSRTYPQFVQHLLQEGIKQVLFAQGTELVETHDLDDKGERSYTRHQHVISKEMIQFLLDHDMIEEYNF